MNNIRFFEQSIRKIENVINRNMAKLANPLESVRGIGPVYSAGIIAEVGDTACCLGILSIMVIHR